MIVSRVTDIETCECDGVVRLRQAFEPQWIGLLRAGIDRDMANPGARFEQRMGGNSAARYGENC